MVNNDLSDKERWQKRYENGNTPWDSGQPDGDLVVFVENNVREESPKAWICLMKRRDI